MQAPISHRSHANYKEYLITKNVHNYVTRPPLNSAQPQLAAWPAHTTRLPTILYGHINKAMRRPMASLLSLSIEHSVCRCLSFSLSLFIIKRSKQTIEMT